jgi:glutathione synthase/RimK-type ligase-like ATP-grasp enzyme
MFAGKNLWVFKPSDYNRGRGVNLVNSLDQLRKLVQDYTVGVEVQ